MRRGLKSGSAPLPRFADVGVKNSFCWIIGDEDIALDQPGLTTCARRRSRMGSCTKMASISSGVANTRVMAVIIVDG